MTPTARALRHDTGRARSCAHIGHTEAMNTPQTLEIQDFTQHRIRLLLPALILVTLAYPLSEIHAYAAMGYALTCAAVLALGARVAAVTRMRQFAATAVAAMIALLSVPWAMFPDELWLTVGFYTMLVIFNLLVIAAIGEHLFDADAVDHNIMLTGTSLFILVGHMFVPAAMVVEKVTVELTGASAYLTEMTVTWQQMVYFSFTTLTTLGSDGLRPATTAAQALAILEAVLGVLIVALIVGRLVGTAVLHTHRPRTRA